MWLVSFVFQTLFTALPNISIGVLDSFSLACCSPWLLPADWESQCDRRALCWPPTTGNLLLLPDSPRAGCWGGYDLLPHLAWVPFPGTGAAVRLTFVARGIQPFCQMPHSSFPGMIQPVPCWNGPSQGPWWQGLSSCGSGWPHILVLLMHPWAICFISFMSRVCCVGFTLAFPILLISSKLGTCQVHFFNRISLRATLK